MDGSISCRAKKETKKERLSIRAKLDDFGYISSKSPRIKLATCTDEPSFGQTRYAFAIRDYSDLVDKTADDMQH
jgi:hypothetical protein